MKGSSRSNSSNMRAGTTVLLLRLLVLRCWLIVPVAVQALNQQPPPHKTTTTTTTTTTPSFMKPITGLASIVTNYDIFVLDMWGVLHDGFQAYPGVLECIQQLHDNHKQIIILSNSSKRRSHAEKLLQKLNFTGIDRIMTSGEVALHVLQEWNDDVPRQALVLGSGDKDEEYLQAAGWTMATPEDAHLIVARGTFTVHTGSNVVHKRHNAEAYHQALDTCLQTCVARNLPMLVCNPDKIRPDAERPPMPGMLGDAYARINPNAVITRIGKPFPLVYQRILETAPLASRICMIGDALETDIAGGQAAGIDTVWVLKDGIHSPDTMVAAVDSPGEDDDATEEEEDWPTSAQRILDAFGQEKGTYAEGLELRPTYIIPHFQW